ncbi:MAG: hypothetical protein NVS3B3_16490 [Aquirhabdus sp.]
MSKLNFDRKSRRGHPKLTDSECRKNCVSVRLNEAELELLNRRRGALKRGEWLRMAALDQLPPAIPELNQKAWVELARAAANLNQIASNLNHGEPVDIQVIRDGLVKFRNDLVGLNTESECDF